MSKGIRISEKHGVNPMLVVCSWCGEDEGSIALLGKLKGDVAAPMHGVLDDQPCEECKKAMALGITCIEVSHEPREGEKADRTGRWWVIKEEAVQRLIREPLLSDVLKRRQVYVSPEIVKQLGFAVASADA